MKIVYIKLDVLRVYNKFFINQKIKIKQEKMRKGKKNIKTQKTKFFCGKHENF